MLPYPNHQYYLSSQEVPPPPNPTFFTSPTSLDHYGHLFPAEQFNSETLEAVLAPPPAVAAEVAVPLAAVARNGAAGGGAARKRPFRTDRHSKIRTAQGVRDRRMRLSLDVARDFFALQDLLGFDKASKTVDWLLTQSKPAIDRLTGTAQHGGGGADAGMSSPSESAGSKEAAAAGSGGGAQDARGKARARARERTVEKMRGRPTIDGSAFMEHGCELDRLVSSSAPFDQPMDRFQYYYFGEMMNNNGADDDEDGGDEEEGDFFDGMQC